MSSGFCRRKDLRFGMSWLSFNVLARIRIVVWQISSVFDDHLEGPGFGSVPEGLVGIEDMAEFKAMGDQNLGVDLVRPQNVEAHRRADGIDQPRGDGDVAVPQALQMEIHLRSVHPD